MTSASLFDVEARVLSEARALLDREGVSAAQYRQALSDLAAHYERLIRETYRLIRRSDREEREMNELNQRLNALAGQLRHRATHDPLTGILNRAAVIEAVARHLKNGVLALIILDIDHFKAINDTYGHPIGDIVIVKVADCLSRTVGPGIEIGRIGGEEFTILLPDRNLDAALELAEKIRCGVAACNFGDPIDRMITISLGVSWNPQGSDFSTAYRRTDEAMYEAKRDGRNRVVAAQS